MTSQADKAALLASLHVPGDPLIVTNIWDAVTARIVADLPEVKALATASHAVSFAHGVPDNEGLTVEQALDAARVIASAVDKPVSVDFEKGYAADAAGVKANVARLIEAGAAGLNIEDSLESAAGPYRTAEDAAARVAAARAAADDAGVPLAINARVDLLVGQPDRWTTAIDRANRYLDAGATSIFFLGLGTEDQVERGVAHVKGPVAVIAHNPARPAAEAAHRARGSPGSASDQGCSDSRSPTCRQRHPPSPLEGTTQRSWGSRTDVVARPRAHQEHSGE